MPGIEWQVKVDRAEASRYGADITAVGNAIKLVTSGIKVGEYRPDDSDDEVEIRVRFPRNDRNIDELDRLRVPTENGAVPIGNFVQRVAVPRVGVIALAGIVVNNNIVLIDTYNILRQRGMDTIEAVVRTGAQRLRPVLLTTITTVLGLMPMVLGERLKFGRRNTAERMPKPKAIAI